MACHPMPACRTRACCVRELSATSFAGMKELHRREKSDVDHRDNRARRDMIYGGEERAQFRRFRSGNLGTRD